MMKNEPKKKDIDTLNDRYEVHSMILQISLCIMREINWEIDYIYHRRCSIPAAQDLSTM